MDLLKNIPEYIKKSELWQQFDDENFNFEEIPEEFKDFSILSENFILSLKKQPVSSEYVDVVVKIFKLLNYWMAKELDYDILYIVMKIHIFEEYNDKLYPIPLYKEIKEFVHHSNEELDRLSLKNKSVYISGFRFYRMTQYYLRTKNPEYDLNHNERIKIKYLVINYQSTNNWHHLKNDNLKKEKKEHKKYFDFINERISDDSGRLKFLSYCDTSVSKKYKDKAKKIYFEDDGDCEEITKILEYRNLTDQLVFLCNNWDDMTVLEYFDYSSVFFEGIGLKDLIDDFRQINPDISWSYLYESETIIIYKDSLENDYSSMLNQFYGEM